ncbi:MAG: helix-turn-helix domain-containing protein, partial [Desulfuromonadaceae bacterium]
ILPLALYFLKNCASRWDAEWEITDEALAGLFAYPWPGNIRELKNTIRRACILATEPVITADLLPFEVPKMPLPVRGNGGQDMAPVPLWVVERDHISRVLGQVQGNKSKAARILEIDRKTLYTKLERYQLES